MRANVANVTHHKNIKKPPLSPKILQNSGANGDIDAQKKLKKMGLIPGSNRGPLANLVIDLECSLSENYTTKPTRPLTYETQQHFGTYRFGAAFSFGQTYIHSFGRSIRDSPLELHSFEGSSITGKVDVPLYEGSQLLCGSDVAASQNSRQGTTFVTGKPIRHEPN